MRLPVYALSFLTAVVAFLGIAGCNPGPSPELFATSALPAPEPFTVSTTVAVPTNSGTVTIAMPATATFSGQAVLPVSNVVNGTQLVQTLSDLPASNVPALGHIRRRPSSADGIVAILYLNYTTNNDIVMSGNPSFSFTMPSSYNLPGVDYYLALFPGSAWGMGYAGPGTFTGSVLSFTGAFSFTVTANTNIGIALYAQPATLPPATIPPKPSPVPCPSGTATCGSTAVTIP